MRTPRSAPEKEFAIAIVLEFAEQNLSSFSMLGFYDEDAEFIDAVAERLSLSTSVAFHAKMTRVVRRLVNYDVLMTNGTTSNHKEYIGEPSKQRNYWLLPGKVSLLRRGQTEVTMTPLGEAKFLLRRAYPEDAK